MAALALFLIIVLFVAAAIALAAYYPRLGVRFLQRGL
jgi:hypothetical protein